jgi:hypothetical protein
VDQAARDMHALSQTVKVPLRDLGWDALCPGSEALPGILARYR